MADPIIPAGAFAAMKAGQPQPSAAPKEAPAPKAVAPRAPEPVKEPPRDAPPPEEMTPAEKKIWKLKADGEEFDFDASDEEAIKREIMKARGADKRFQSAAQLKKQAESFFEMIKNPESLKKVLQDPRVGIDLKKFAEDYVWEQIQEQQMTPEQRAAREKDRRLAELEARDADSTRERESRAAQERQSKWEGEYERKIIQALETKGIPKSPKIVSEMAYYLEKALENGYDLSPHEIATLVQTDMGNHFKEYVEGLNEDQFLAFLGEHNAEKLRKADVKRLKSPRGNPFPERQKSQGEPKQQSHRDKKVPASEWKEDLVKSFMNRPR